jgi:hypothetical protein
MKYCRLQIDLEFPHQNLDYNNLDRQDLLGLVHLGQYDSSSSTINVASGATFKVISGTPGVGDVAGSGSTVITGEGTVLTVNSLIQSSLVVGAGAKLMLRPASAGALAEQNTQPVPEPAALIMLLSALIMVLALRKSNRSRLN